MYFSGLGRSGLGPSCAVDGPDAASILGQKTSKIPLDHGTLSSIADAIRQISSFPYARDCCEPPLGISSSRMDSWAEIC